MAVTGHGNGLYLVDEEGHPVRNGIISTDSRAKSTLRDGNAHQNSLPTFCQNDAVHLGRTTCRPAGMAEGFRARDAAKARYIFMVKDLIRFYLTGEAFLELTDISGTNLINVRDCKYDDELLAWWGLDELRDKLPPSNAQQNAAENH